MRRLILGFGGLLGLAGCNLNIGISGSDTVNASGSATDTDPGPATGTGTATDTVTGGPGSSSGPEPTTASDVTGEMSTTEPVAPSTGEVSTGEVSTTTEVSTSGTEGETFADTTGESSTGEPTAPGDASVHDSCAPNDGPALEFRLALDAATCEAGWADEQLRVMIFQGGPLAPGEYSLAQGGFASLQPKGVQDPVTTNDGTLTIVSWDDGGVTGSYALTFPNAEVREGSFAGPYCPGNFPCG